MNRRQREQKRKQATAHRLTQAERKRDGHVPVHQRKQPKKPKES